MRDIVPRGTFGTFTNSQTISRTAVTAACGTPQTFTNTATATSTTPNTTLLPVSDSASVAVTKECPPPTWCSPGFWAQNYPKLVNTPYDITEYLDDAYSTVTGGAPLKKGDANSVTIGQVLASPRTYGGPAFNSVANYLSFKTGMNGTRRLGTTVRSIPSGI